MGEWSIADSARRKEPIARGLPIVLMLLLCACSPSSNAPALVATPSGLEPSGQRSELCSAANVVGVGLRGEYFAQPHWRGEPLLTRVDAAVDFLGSLDLPPSLQGKAPQSIRWTGWVKAPTDGRYRFHVQPAQARVLVSRADVRAGARTTNDGIELVAGRFYPITVEVEQLQAGNAAVRLEWTAPHGARYVIPKAVLNLPTETVAPPAGG